MNKDRWSFLFAPEGEGGGGGGGTPPPAAPDPMKLLLDEIKALKAGLAELKPKPEPEKKTEPPPDKPGDKPQPPADPRLARLESQLAEEKERRKESERKAEEKERHGILRGLLGDYEFQSPRARDDAFSAFAREVKRGEGDTLVGPDGAEPAADYVKRLLEGDRGYALRTKDIGGAGAANGGQAKKSPPVDLNSIKPGMSQEDLARARAEIARVAQLALRGE